MICPILSSFPLVGARQNSLEKEIRWQMAIGLDSSMIGSVFH
jgi:hypothetical protein